MKRPPSFAAALQQRILVLDGAMGTQLQQFQFDEAAFRGQRFADFDRPLKGNNDLLNLTQPQAVQAVHRSYLDAGADLIETNTFSATTIGMADYGLESVVDDLNVEGARLAVEVARSYTDKPRWVAGSIGPTNRTASMSPDVNRPGFRNIHFDELREAYGQQIRALIRGGVDVLLIETVFDTLNAKAALFAAQEAMDELGQSLPLMLSGTLTDASGRTLSGQTLEAFLISVSHVPLTVVGLNCALGAAQLLPYVRQMAQWCQCAVSVYPNAGLPNAFGHYDQSPADMAQQLQPYLDEGLLNIVGGCCGTTPAHIQAISALTTGYAPKPITLPTHA